MSVQLRLRRFELIDDGTKVRVNAEVKASPPNPDEITYLYVAVGADEPIKMARGRGTTCASIDAIVPIPKTVRAVGRHHGSKPITVTAYGCWVNDEPQALGWIQANCAESTRSEKVLYLSNEYISRWLVESY